MITEATIVDSINVLADGQIQVRRADVVYRDGVVIAKNYHRHVVHPGMSLVNEDPRVMAIAKAVHTPSVIKTFEALISRAAG